MRALYEKNLAFLPISHSRYLIAEYLEGRGILVAALGVPLAAAQLWGAAEALRESLGAPMYSVDRDDYVQAIAAARTQMSETAFAAAWIEGRALSPEIALIGIGDRRHSPGTCVQRSFPVGTRRVKSPAGASLELLDER